MHLKRGARAAKRMRDEPAREGTLSRAICQSTELEKDICSWDDRSLRVRPTGDAGEGATGGAISVHRVVLDGDASRVRLWWCPARGMEDVYSHRQVGTERVPANTRMSFDELMPIPSSEGCSLEAVVTSDVVVSDDGAVV
jgi:hypothetical protein